MPICPKCGAEYKLGESVCPRCDEKLPDEEGNESSATEFFSEFIDTWKAVVKAPADFFKTMPTSGGYAAPLKFVLICSLPSALFMGIFRPVVGFLLSPVVLLLSAAGVFIISTLVHAGVILFAGENHKNYEATFRAVSYSQAPSVFSWLPVIGILAVLYGFYFGIIGVSQIHRISYLKAALAYLAPPFIIIVLMALTLGLSFNL